MSERRLPLLLAIALLACAPQPVAAGTESSADVTNPAPDVLALEVPPGVQPAAGADRIVPVTFTARDGNGKKDLARAELEVRTPAGGLHRSTTWNLTPEETEGNTQDVATQFTMAFHDPPATGNDTYTVRVRVQDIKQRWGAWVEAAFEYDALAAIALDGTGVPFGTIEPGARTAAAAVLVRNTGNVPVDLDVSGTELTGPHGATIDVGRIRYADDATMANETALTGAPVTIDLGLAPGPHSTAKTWWALDTPSGQEQYVPAGEYRGAITIGAVAA